jgi:hypothetical protein
MIKTDKNGPLTEAKGKMENHFTVVSAEEQTIHYFSNGFRVTRSKEGTITFRKEQIAVVDVIGFSKPQFYQIDNLVYYTDDTNTKTFNFTTHEIGQIERKYTNIINHYHVGEQLWIQEHGIISRVGERANFQTSNCELIIKATDDYVVVCEPMHYNDYGYDYLYTAKSSNYKVFSGYNIHCSILRTSDLSILQKAELDTIAPATYEFKYKTYKNYLNMIRDSIIISKDEVEIYDVKFKLMKEIIEECCVCMEDKRMVKLMPCKHRICAVCSGKINSTCPQCRQYVVNTEWASA